MHEALRAVGLPSTCVYVDEEAARAPDDYLAVVSIQTQTQLPALHHAKLLSAAGTGRGYELLPPSVAAPRNRFAAQRANASSNAL